MTRHVLKALLAVALLASCDAPTATRPAFEYNPTTLSNGVLYRWPSGSVITVWLQSDETSGLSLLGAVARAVDAWNGIPEFREYRMQRAPNLQSADIVVYDRVVPSPLRPGSCLFDPRGSGYTYFCLRNGLAERLTTTENLPTQATVLISVDRTRVTTQGAYDAVVAHEFGHALGIGGHSDVATDVMFAGATASFPTGRDRRTMNYVLGQPADAFLR